MTYPTSFAGLLAITVLSLTAAAHPTDGDQVDQIPAGTEFLFISDVNIKPNTSETLFQSDGHTRCMLKHDTNTKDRVVKAGRLAILKGLSLERSPHPLNTGDFALTKVVSFQLSGFKSEINLTCYGIKSSVDVGRAELISSYLPKRVFGGYDSLTIGAVKAILKFHIGIRFPQTVEFED